MTPRMTRVAPPAMSLALLLAVVAIVGCGSIERADGLFAEGRYLRAVEAYREVYADHRRDPEVNRRVAIAYDRLGRLDRAEKFYRRVVELQPDDVDAHWQLARCRAERKLYQDALRSYGHVIQRRPDSAAAWSNAGLMHLHLGAHDDAERHFARALEIDDEHPAALLNMGLLYSQFRDSPERAEDYLRRYRRAAPDGARAAAVSEYLLASPETQVAGGRSGGRSAPAPVDSERSTTGDETAPPALDEPDPQPGPPVERPRPTRDRATFEQMAAEGRFTEIIELAGDLSVDDPRCPELCTPVGRAHLFGGDPRVGFALLRAATVARPEAPEPLLAYGWAQRYLGHEGEARRIWRDGIRRFPDHAADFREALESSR